MAYFYYGFPKYVSVGEKRARAEKNLVKLRKKDPDIEPIILKGNKLVYTWWGKAWNQNLESYRDYAYRIERGRSYIRHGAVLDLRIKPGLVTALVQGSEQDPYKIEIKISALKSEIWKGIKKTCTGKLTSLQELLEGKFPKELAELFTGCKEEKKPGSKSVKIFNRQTGLFPSPEEIRFHCSCPDYASLCKHVAAVLYGVGSRLDSDPGLFFKLRKIDINELITETVKQRSSQLLGVSVVKGKRIINNENLAGLFGVDLVEPETTSPKNMKRAAGSTVHGTSGKTLQRTRKQGAKKSITKASPEVKKAKKPEKRTLKKSATKASPEVKKAKKPEKQAVKKSVKKASSKVKKAKKPEKQAVKKSVKKTSPEVKKAGKVKKAEQGAFKKRKITSAKLKN